MHFLIRRLFLLLTFRQSRPDRFRSGLKSAHRLPLSLESLEDRFAPAVVTWSGGGSDLSLNNLVHSSTNTLPGSANQAVINVSHSSGDNSSQAARSPTSNTQIFVPDEDGVPMPGSANYDFLRPIDGGGAAGGNTSGGGGNSPSGGNGTPSSLGNGQLFATSSFASGGTLDIVGNLSPLVSPLSVQLANTTTLTSNPPLGGIPTVISLGSARDTNTSPSSEGSAPANTDDFGPLQEPQPPNEDHWDQLDDHSDVLGTVKQEAPCSSETLPALSDDLSDELGPEQVMHSVIGMLDASLPNAYVDALVAAVRAGEPAPLPDTNASPMQANSCENESGEPLSASCLGALVTLVTGASRLWRADAAEPGPQCPTRFQRRHPASRDLWGRSH